MKSLFEAADVIHTYSRAQAISDGVLVNLMPEFSATIREAGIKVPVAATAEVHAKCIALTRAAEKMGCDTEGRLWDILTMFKKAYVPNLGTNTVTFQVYVVCKRISPTLTTLKAVIGPGDDGQPTLTLMFPGEG